MYLMIVTFLSFILCFIHSQDKTFKKYFINHESLNEKNSIFHVELGIKNSVLEKGIEYARRKEE
jgi:hypothetical protein